MAQTYKTEGIILKRRPHRERDKLVTIFTRDYGKLTARAISARKITSKLAGHLEPFICADFHLARSKTIDIVAGSNTIHAHKRLRSQLSHAASAGFFSEVVEQFTHTNHADPELYDHVRAFYTWLNNNDAHALAVYAALLRLFALAGFHTDWYQCHSCKRRIQEEEGSKFHFALWNVECSNCRSTEETMPLSVSAVKVLRFLSGVDFSEARRLEVTQATWEEVHACMQAILQYHGDYPLRSQQLFVDMALDASSVSA